MFDSPQIQTQWDADGAAIVARKYLKQLTDLTVGDGGVFLLVGWFYYRDGQVRSINSR